LQVVKNTAYSAYVEYTSFEGTKKVTKIKDLLSTILKDAKKKFRGELVSLVTFDKAKRFVSADLA